MPVPTLITELSTTIASNSPAGSESPASLDDYQRAYAAFIAQLYTGTVAAPTVIVASATSTAIGAAASENVDISGTITITGFGTAAEGINRKGRFTGALTLTHNATSLILPGGANITTSANDRYEARSLGAGNWIVTKYVYASGQVVIGALAVTGTGSFSGGTLSNTRAIGSDTYINHTTTGLNNTVIGFNNSGSTNGQGVLNNHAYIGTLNAYNLAITCQGVVPAVFSSAGLAVTGLISATTSITGATLVSTVATGTAPFTVSSTTAVANLTATNLSGGTVAATTISASGLITANGGQIAFPATAVPSADPNTLDDYEEGTWTPSLGGTATYDTQTGTYTKIGRLVFISGTIAVNVIGSGSTIDISGLPFAAGAACAISVHQWQTLATSGYAVTAAAYLSSVSFRVSSSLATSEGGSPVFGSGASLYFAGTYYV